MIITSVATLDAAGGIRRNCKAICRCLLHLHGTLRGLLPGGGHAYDSLATNFPLVVASEAGPLMRMAKFQIGQVVRDRKSVVEGKSVSVRLDLGGRRIIKKKKKKK